LICNSLFPWLHGRHLFIVPPFKPDLILGLCSLLDEHEITFLSSVPTVWRLALKTSTPPRSRRLERVFCGSAPLSAHLWSDIRRWTGARDVWNAYGITETGSWLAGTSVEGFVPQDGLVGEPWGGAIEVVRTGGAPARGEECAPGENGQGSHARADARLSRPRRPHGGNRLRGLVSHGDVGCLDERGWLYLRGREREEINKGGMKIYPADVDAVVEQFDGALDVCAFAIEDALYGEDVAVAVVLRDPSAATLGALRDWMALHLARHQMPRRWYVVDEIPRTSRGKVNRSAVAARCAGLRPVAPRVAGSGS
jgi:acyl-CoA synthetase (AMP-forming)/AMP-acid ligase II